jgi:hypothetical protein
MYLLPSHFRIEYIKYQEHYSDWFTRLYVLYERIDEAKLVYKNLVEIR